MPRRPAWHQAKGAVPRVSSTLRDYQGRARHHCTRFAFHIDEESMAAEAALNGLYLILRPLSVAQVYSAEVALH